MRAGELKSTDSPFAINARSEKSAKFNLFQINAPRGYMNFTGQYTNNPATGSGGNGLADMLVGIPALSENLTKWAYYEAFQILRTARSSRLLTASRLALSNR